MADPSAPAPARFSLDLARPAVHVDVSPGGEIVLRGSYQSTHDGSVIDAATTTWPKETPGGAWDLHAKLIPNSPPKPLRIWMEVSDRDLLTPNVMRDDMHDWVLANERMAKVLADKKYRYQYVFARNAGHSDRAVKLQTLPHALEWLWKDYPAEGTAGGR